MMRTSLSVAALLTALAMTVPAVQAQVSISTDAATDAAGSAAGSVTGGDGAVDAAASGDAAAGVTVGGDASSDGGSTSGSGQVGLTLDANADGSISADEIAAADAAIGGDVSIDIDGDGVISAEEALAANATLAGLGGTDTLSCDAGGLEAAIAGMGEPDMAALGMAGSFSIVVVGDCEEGEVSAALASEGATGIRDALGANADAVAAIQARGASLADVLGATTSGDTVTVYVASDA